MKIFAILFLACSITSCLTKRTVTIRDRGEAFAHDTSIVFSQFAGEPGPVSRRITFNISGKVEVINGFIGYPMDPSKAVMASISPDSVRLLIQAAIDAGILTAPDSAFAEPAEGILDGPSHYHFELNVGRKSKSVKTDGSDRSLNKLIGVYNVAEYWAWERLPEAKRWRWYGPAWTLEDIRKLK